MTTLQWLHRDRDTCIQHEKIRWFQCCKWHLLLLWNPWAHLTWIPNILHAFFPAGNALLLSGSKDVEFRGHVTQWNRPWFSDVTACTLKVWCSRSLRQRNHTKCTWPACPWQWGKLLKQSCHSKLSVGYCTVTSDGLCCDLSYHPKTYG